LHPNAIPDLPIEQWRDYIASRDIEQRNAIAVYYYPLACWHAERVKTKHRLPASIQLDDLVSGAGLGLLQAVERYDPDRGVPFPPWAILRIRGAIMDTLRVMDYLKRNHRATSGDDAPKLKSIDSLMYGKLTASGTVELDGDRAVSYADRMAAPDGRVAEKLETRELVRAALSRLPRQSRLLLMLYYGAGLTMREAGEAAGVSESRVSQILSREAVPLFRAEMTNVA